jgi:hypothetical protein
MEVFKVDINRKEFTVTPALHQGFYEITSGSQSGMLTKDSEGKWELLLQSSNAMDISAEELGKKIEEYQSTKSPEE